MKIFYCFIALLSSQIASSQNAYKITYQQTTAGGYKMKNILVFNDSFCLSYFVNANNPDPYKKPKTVGAKIIQHAIFFDNISKTIYDEDNWNVPQPSLIVHDSLVWNNLTYLEDKNEKILGYICKAVRYKNGAAEQIIWYTTEIPYSYGPYYFYGLPGLVLKTFSPSDGGSNQAIKIEKGDFKMVKPDARIISEEEFRNLKRN